MLWLSSPSSGSVTGQTVVVDGGGSVHVTPDLRSWLQVLEGRGELARLRSPIRPDQDDRRPGTRRRAACAVPSTTSSARSSRWCWATPWRAVRTSA
ncbi:hypothetical protein HBB16_03985 [Pseudonocardia sp. MCCB 268]|nr:hypothetical protein [Pseudonocardia cytotoxica]